MQKFLIAIFALASLLITPSIFCQTSSGIKAVNPSLDLEIELDKGVIKGYIRNNNVNAVRVEIPETYGWWEGTSVFYLHGSRWREAPYLAEYARLGAIRGPDYVELESGQILRTDGIWKKYNTVRKRLSPSQLRSTFEIHLSQHELPNDYWNISEIRVVTRGLWSNIIKVRDPLHSLKPEKQPEQK